MMILLSPKTDPQSFMGPPSQSPIPRPLTLSRTSHFDHSLSAEVGLARSRLKGIQAGIQHAIANPKPDIQNRLNGVNHNRQKKGLPPINLLNTSREIERVYEYKGLSKKQKEKRVEQIRKKLGLSKGDMKALFTKRLAKIYDRAEKSVARYQNFKREQLNREIQAAEKIYGKNSPQVQALRQKQAIIMAVLEPHRQAYGQRAGFYHSFYPSFWGRLKGFFKKIGGGIATVVGAVGGFLKKIPGLGSLVSVASGLIRPIGDLFRGKFGSFFKNMGKGILNSVRHLPQLLPLIPGLGTVASVALQFLNKIPRFHPSVLNPPERRGIQFVKSNIPPSFGNFRP